MPLKDTAKQFLFNRLDDRSPQGVAKGIILFGILAVIISFGFIGYLPSLVSALQEGRTVFWVVLTLAYALLILLIVLKILRRLIGEDIDLSWQPGHDIWPIKMDPAQIDQILANLSVNARDAIHGVGKLIIETGRATFDEVYCADRPGFIPGDYVLLSVSDNGHGMDRETLENIFEPFFTNKEVGQGTGLGLATVYGIVKQNNRFINVYSELNHGTSFKIYLPRHRTVDVPARPENTETFEAHGHETVLVVEDEATILKVTRMMLERQGYTVLTAATPWEAIDVAQEHGKKIHLLMTDVVMPEMNGRGLAGKLLSLYPNLKCLFMSGYTEDVIAHHGVLDEGVNFIQKPFSKQELSVKVRKALDVDN